MIAKVLLIGIQNYGLDGPHQDIINMIKLIKSLNPNIDNNNIICLVDKPSFLSPTKANILHTLNHIYDNVKEGDDVLLYYSGHGDNLATADKDESDNHDQAMRVLGGHIIDNQLHDLLFKNIPKKTSVYAIFDCCHSGDILDLKYKFIDNKFKIIRPSAESIDNKIVLISGCTQMQSTTDSPKGGAFTNRLIDIMKEYNNKVTYKILFAELDNRLNYLEKYFGMSQDPQIYCTCEQDENSYVF